jgi:hypothetical protein
MHSNHPATSWIPRKRPALFAFPPVGQSGACPLVECEWGTVSSGGTDAPRRSQGGWNRFGALQRAIGSSQTSCHEDKNEASYREPAGRSTGAAEIRGQVTATVNVRSGMLTM